MYVSLSPRSLVPRIGQSQCSFYMRTLPSIPSVTRRKLIPSALLILELLRR
jgi:hypothetical protein